VTEIRVDVPDAHSGSDLTWHLHEHAEVVEGDDGTYVVRVHVNGSSVGKVLSQVRNWVVLHRVDEVVVHVGDERFTLSRD
jgi:hypothetical protein